jgi:hypothetical protein
VYAELGLSNGPDVEIFRPQRPSAAIGTSLPSQNHSVEKSDAQCYSSGTVNPHTIPTVASWSCWRSAAPLASDFRRNVRRAAVRADRTNPPGDVVAMPRRGYGAISRFNAHRHRMTGMAPARRLNERPSWL